MCSRVPASKIPNRDLIYQTFDTGNLAEGRKSNRFTAFGPILPFYVVENEKCPNVDLCCIGYESLTAQLPACPVWS
jgi:hypothetical protein